MPPPLTRVVVVVVVVGLWGRLLCLELVVLVQESLEEDNQRQPVHNSEHYDEEHLFNLYAKNL